MSRRKIKSNKRMVKIKTDQHKCISTGAIANVGNVCMGVIML